MTEADNIADAIRTGQQPPDTKGLFRLGPLVRSKFQEKGFDLTTASRDYTAIQKHIATLNGPGQERLRQSIVTLNQLLPQVEEYYRKWQASGLPTGFKEFNRKALTAAANLPGEAGANANLLQGLIADVTSDLAGIYRGGNAATDEAFDLSQKNLQGDWNQTTFERAVKLLKHNAQIRYNSIMSSPPAGVTPGSPYLPKIFPETPVPGTPPPAAQRFQVGGREIVPQADGWHYKDTGQKVQ
jgi:hypothetical protein